VFSGEEVPALFGSGGADPQGPGGTRTGSVPADGQPALLLSIDRVAQVLSVSRAMVYRMLASGELDVPVVRLGRRVLIARADLERWVALTSAPV
jgi:excisionase family DNA binding protein